jgi:hypothetical protein
MWVLTFAESQTNRGNVMWLVSNFARRLRALRGGQGFPYWYSPELHPEGHGWHVNIFIPFRVRHDVFAPLWGHGFVWVTDFATAQKGPKGEPMGLCRSLREGLRRAAFYGCKYSQKDWSPEHVGRGRHRYEIGQGFSPTGVSQWVDSPAEAQALVVSLVPEEDRHRLRDWDSNSEIEWSRPPIWTWRW